jgi:hypothetical protein
MTDQIKIRATVMWAYLDKPNEMSGKFQVDLCELSDKAVLGLEELGVEVKSKDGKGKFITCKSQRPIFAYDDGGTQLNGTIVGNGSKAACLVNTYDWTFKGKKGKGAGIKKMVITDLMEYVGGGGGMDVEEDDIL